MVWITVTSNLGHQLALKVMNPNTRGSKVAFTKVKFTVSIETFIVEQVVDSSYYHMSLVECLEDTVNRHCMHGYEYLFIVVYYQSVTV